MTTPKVDALRERILDAALRQFAQQGFAGTSVQRVADAAGVSKQLLLYHFGSKNDLKRAVVDGIIARWRELLPTLGAAAAQGAEDLEGVVRSTIAAFTEAPEASRFILRELMTPDSEVSRQLEEAFVPPLWRWVAVDGVDPRSTTLEVIGIALLAITGIHHVDSASRQRYLDHIEGLMIGIVRGER